MPQLRFENKIGQDYRTERAQHVSQHEAVTEVCLPLK